jgi:DNA (cytosine-5)-methyltransferase 1
MNDALRELSLCTGYAGYELGMRLAGVRFKTVCYCEIEKYCQEIIKARIKDGYLDDAPIWDDIRTLDGKELAGLVDIITGGFPCQPHSVAGRRLGEEDSRDLWPDFARLIRDIRPEYVLLENVPGILAPGKINLLVLKVLRQIGLFGEENNIPHAGKIIRNIVKALGQPFAGRVIGELAEIGYDCIWDCIPASYCGAPHLRWRWWALAYDNRQRQQQPQGNIEKSGGRAGNGGEDVSHTAKRKDIKRKPGDVVKEAERGEGINAAAGIGGDVADTKRFTGALRATEGEKPGRFTGGGIISDTIGNGLQGERDGRGDFERPAGLRSGEGKDKEQVIPHTEGELLDRKVRTRRGRESPANSGWWEVEPALGRVVDGCADRVDCLKALGNGNVPEVVKRFLRGE